MIQILGISGSLRAGSFNTALLRAARPLAGAGVRLDVATLHGIPLYDGDLEQREGPPPAVLELKERIVASHGVLLATPEYNNSLPGVLPTSAGITAVSARPPQATFRHAPSHRGLHF